MDDEAQIREMEKDMAMDAEEIRLLKGRIIELETEVAKLTLAQDHVQCHAEVTALRQLLAATAAARGNKPLVESHKQHDARLLPKKFRSLNWEK